MTKTTDPKQVVLDYVAAFNRGDLDALRNLLAPDAEVQGVMGQGAFERIAPVWRQLIDGYQMQLRIDAIIAEGNEVAVRFTETGPSCARLSAISRQASPTKSSRWNGSR